MRDPNGRAAVSAPKRRVNGEARPIRVLQIEDDHIAAALLCELLGESRQVAFEVESVDCLLRGLERLSAGGIDVVLLDLSLPDGHGLDTFTRAHAHAPEVPIIVFSGHDDEALAVEAMKAGAQDYLVKGQVNGQLLVRAIRYALERKRSAEVLAHERDLLHALLNNIPDRIYFKDSASRYVRINNAMARLFQLADPAAAVGKTDFDFFDTEHASVAFADEHEIMQTGQPLIGRVEKETLADGRTNWILTTKMPLRDRNGRIIGTFGVSRDITTLKEMERSLSEERNLLRNLIDHLPDYIYIKDAAGRYAINNRAHNHLLHDRPRAEVIGHTAFDLFPNGEATAHHLDDAAAIQSGQPIINREEPLRDAEGRERWLLTTKVPLRDREGRVTGLVSISRDITNRRDAEERLRTANVELQRANAALQEMQMQLIHAEQMQSAGRLAAGVAHEVKNPLAILRMGVDFFSQFPLLNNGSADMVLDDMKLAIKRADSIVMGLLDFSVPGQLRMEPVDVNDLVEKSLRLLRHELMAQDYQVQRQFDMALPRSLLDLHKVEQVLVNLLTNALHAMPRGGTLTVRTSARQLQPGEIPHDAGSRSGAGLHAGAAVIRVEIDDTGSGIPPDHLAKIFDPFFTTKPTGKGTGLGLTVARKIIELHGGSLEIGNRPEGGARATLLFKAELETK